MKKMIFPCLALAVVLTACSTSQPMPDTLSYSDAFAAGGVDMIPENLLEGGQSSDNCVWLNAARISQDSSHNDYYLELRYAARQEAGLLDIPPGKSLVVTADGQEIEFRSASGSLNNRQKKKGVLTETALFPAAPEQLRTIAAANRVTVKVVAQKATIERSFGPANSERFRKFVRTFVR